jgi:SNF2 family DNA or RNA helicase
LLSINAASLGLNLAAASNVVFAELSWSHSTMMHAENRVHRINQKGHVNIYYLSSNETIDKFIIERLLEKDETIFTLLDKENRELMTFNANELKIKDPLE